jgi:hypothetical protein
LAYTSSCQLMSAGDMSARVELPRYAEISSLQRKKQSVTRFLFRPTIPIQILNPIKHIRSKSSTYNKQKTTAAVHPCRAVALTGGA